MLGFRTNARECYGDGCCADASLDALASLVITDLVMPASIAHANTHTHTHSDTHTHTHAHELQLANALGTDAARMHRWMRSRVFWILCLCAGSRQPAAGGRRGGEGHDINLNLNYSSHDAAPPAYKP
jgi:hypothetical protein